MYSLKEFRQYFLSGQGQLWERQALCKARPCVVSSRMRPAVEKLLHEILDAHPWLPEFARQIAQMRTRLEETAKDLDIKRGRGGIVDIEFLVQMLQLRHGRQLPQLKVTSTLDALRVLRECEILDEKAFSDLAESYRYLRTVENRLQLINPTAKSRVPENPLDLARLAHLMDAETPPALVHTIEAYLARNRQYFERWVERLASQ